MKIGSSSSPYQSTPARFTGSTGVKISKPPSRISSGNVNQPSVAKRDTSSESSKNTESGPRDSFVRSTPEDEPRGSFIDPTKFMFQSESSSSSHNTGDLSKGTFDVGAAASKGSIESKTTKTGNTVSKESEKREAHASASASGGPF